MKTVKRIVMALTSLVVGAFVISFQSSAFAEISWLPISVGTNAIIDNALAQVDGGTIQLDLLKEDGSGFAAKYMFYWSGHIPTGSTRTDVQRFEDQLLNEALQTIDLSDRSLVGRTFSVGFVGFQYGLTNINAIFGGGYTFQLDDSNGELKIPATAYQINVVEATMRYFAAFEGVKLAIEKTPKVVVSVVPAQQARPLSTATATTVSPTKSVVRLTIFGQAGSTVKVEGTPSFCDIKTSRWSPVTTVTLDSEGKGVYDVDMSSVSGNQFYRAGVD